MKPDVDVEGDVGQGLELVFQHLAAEELAKYGGTVALGHARERKAHRSLPGGGQARQQLREMR